MCFMYDLDRGESRLYSSRKSMTLLQKITELWTVSNP